MDEQTTRCKEVKVPRTEFLPFSPPQIGDEEIDAVADALRSGWISKGPRTAEFESRFADFLGAEAALGLNSCTAGLHLALLVSEVGPGDEVVVPTMTFCATANVVEHVGARTILVDVDPVTLNVDPQRFADAITDRTRAVMVVHYAGHPAPMTEIRDIADRHGIVVIEDAAHALPASYQGTRVGSGAGLTAFSFYATKNLTTGEGGMLVGAEHLIDKARVMSLHGMSGDAWRRYGKKGRWFYEVVSPGFKYNMTDIQAAMGAVQLKRLAGFQERRRALVARYRKLLGSLPLVLPTEKTGVESAWHLFAVRVNAAEASVDRNALIEALTEMNIGTSVHFIPVHKHPYYRDRYGYTDAHFPVASRAFEELLSLPLHPGLSDGDQDDVCDALVEALALRDR